MRITVTMPAFYILIKNARLQRLCAGRYGQVLKTPNTEMMSSQLLKMIKKIVIILEN